MKVDVLGWSMGANTSFLAAQKDDSNMASLTFLGWAYNLEWEVPLDTGKIPAMDSTKAENAYEDFVVKGSISQEAIDAYTSICLKTDPIKVDWNQRHQFNDTDPSQIELPFLLIQGEHDQYAKTEWQLDLFGKIKSQDKSWVVISGVDHMIPFETRKEKFFDTLTDFIEHY